MEVAAKLMIDEQAKAHFLLAFPVAIQLPRCAHFLIWWGCQPMGVKAVGQLTPSLYELHLEPAPAFPILEAGKYESIPDSCLGKIRIAYDGKIREALTGVVLEAPEFQVTL